MQKQKAETSKTGGVGGGGAGVANRSVGNCIHVEQDRSRLTRKIKKKAFTLSELKQFTYIQAKIEPGNTFLHKTFRCKK